VCFVRTDDPRPGGAARGGGLLEVPLEPCELISELGRIGTVLVKHAWRGKVRVNTKQCDDDNTHERELVHASYA
jgi:hypothetical protein